MVTWDELQSAIQLIAGGNLAIFGFPQIAKPFIESENENWNDFQLSVPFGHENWIDVLEARNSFTLKRLEIERKVDTIRSFSLIIAVGASALLVWASWSAEAQLTPGGCQIVWGSLIIGTMPAIILYGLNGYARCSLEQFAERRRALAQQIKP